MRRKSSVNKIQRRTLRNMHTNTHRPTDTHTHTLCPSLFQSLQLCTYSQVRRFVFPSFVFCLPLVPCSALQGPFHLTSLWSGPVWMRGWLSLSVGHTDSCLQTVWNLSHPAWVPLLPLAEREETADVWLIITVSVNACDCMECVTPEEEHFLIVFFFSTVKRRFRTELEVTFKFKCSFNFK